MPRSHKLDLALLLALPCCVTAGAWTYAQNAGPTPASPAATSLLTTYRSDLPLADPFVTADAQLRARRAVTWTQGDLRFILLEDDASVRVGAYGFAGRRIVVRIDTERKPGRTLRHLSAYFADAVPLFDTGSVGAEGRRLLVTVATTGAVDLQTDDLRSESRVDDDFVRQAMGRFDRYLLAKATPTRAIPPGVLLDANYAQARREATHQAIAQAQTQRLYQRFPGLAAATQPAPGSSPESVPGMTTPGASGTEATTAAQQPAAPTAIIPAKGVMAFNADKIVYQETAPGQSVVALVGNVRLLYEADDGKRNLSVQAENAVIFVDGSAQDIAGKRAQATQVTGIYLEDNVIVTDGSFTVRAPRVFYDLQRNKAVLLQAVLYAWDVDRNIPIYMRAAQLRQESRTSFSAEEALLTTSEFAEPHFAIAADRLTLSQERGDSGKPSYQFAAEKPSFRFAHTTVFGWPGEITGAMEKSALRDVKVGFSSTNGMEIATKWDVFALFGQPRPKGVDFAAQVDVMGKHGLALGANLSYVLPEMYGRLDSYFLPYDFGTDKVGGRNDIEHDGDQRGYIHFQHRQYLPDNWELSLEAAYVSDVTFLEVFQPKQATEARQYETSAYLKKQESDWAFTLLASYDLSNFVTQTTTLQAPGYFVAKAPELGYYRVGTSLWDDRLTWFSETRLSRMALQPGNDKPADRGFDDVNGESVNLFGIPSTTRFKDAILASGVPIAWRYRADTRQEFDAPLKVGDINLTPFVVGRATGYDNNFDEFYPGQDKSYRLWGQVGTRASTQFNRTYDDIEWRGLDVHRLRHIIEPNGEIHLSGTNLQNGQLPVYDPEVEAIQQGFGGRLGLRNILQTQRGGIGRWRSVDWLILDTDYIHRSNNAGNNASIARYYSYRPEYSTGGDAFYTRALWAITDSLASSFEWTYDTDNSETSQWRAGLTLDQSPRLRHGISYTEINPLNERLLSYGLTYTLTKVYALGLQYTLDVGRQESREITASLERKIPGWRVVLVGSYDVINDEQFIGFQIAPEGERPGFLLTPVGPAPKD